MPIHLRNLKKYLHNITPFSPIVLLTTLLIVSVLLYSSPVGGGPYLDSAHGNSSYGVNRTSTSTLGYAKANCAHCHEEHASIGGEELAAPAPYHFALFYDDAKEQCDLFCFTCHSGSATWQPVTNYPYWSNFGGGPTADYNHIHRQFCGPSSMNSAYGSRHNLLEIHASIKNNAVGWGFNSDPNPCVACHNPHADQRNHPVAIDGEGKLNTAIRRPSHYKSTNPKDFLWGDDEGERMSNYASSQGGYYQAPYYGSFGSGQYEPAGDGTQNGSNLPDYVTFCLDCHQYELYDPDRTDTRTGTVVAIDWSAERHGGYPSNTCQRTVYEGTLRAPYNTYEPNQSNYVLSCLDCHEPHGTKKRTFLIRRVINGQIIDAATGHQDQFSTRDVCMACHEGTHTEESHGCWHPGCHRFEKDGDDSIMHGATCDDPALSNDEGCCVVESSGGGEPTF